MWHLEVRHDDSCPVLAGTLARSPAGLHAAEAVTAAGHRVTYIATESP